MTVKEAPKVNNKVEDKGKPGEKGTGATRLEWIKAIGMPAVTLIVTVVGGYYLTGLQKERETREGNEKLYAQLLTQREQSDAQIRKDMFNVVISNFLKEPKKGDLETQVLQLELLASNFNQSLDLAPLFKDVARKLTGKDALATPRNAEFKKRLDLSAANLISKQVDSLSHRGFAKGYPQPLGGWAENFGKPFIDEKITLQRLMPRSRAAPGGKGESIHFQVEIVDVNLERREVEVRLRVDFPGDSEQDVDRHFWVSQYDFPMLDNTQLPQGLRCSIVITEFLVPDGPADSREANSAVKFHLVVFPAASASFKERQDYDDVLTDMLRFSANRGEKEAARP
jgi:hypothetical protein